MHQQKLTLVQDKLLHWQLNDNNTQTGHQYLDNLQLMIMLKKLFFLSPPHQSCDHVCTPLLYRQIHTYIHTQTHILYSKGSWGTTYISSSPVFPAVWGLPGSVYLRDTVLRLGMVYDLWYLAVLHWCTIVISRWAKKEKSCLGPRCWFLGHFLQSFCAIMGVWAL